jgi:2-polyprenyl-6-methoxyphenol hydroxylase-like FAD-dependent oxidoreductase
MAQGANQALQDCLCLSNLIFEYNHGIPLPLIGKINSGSIELIDNPFLSSLVSLVYLYSHSLFNYLTVIEDTRRSKLQRMVSTYEKKRKFHVWLITLFGRFLGIVSTLGTPFGFFLKKSFYQFLAMFGFLRMILFAPMKPVV